MNLLVISFLLLPYLGVCRASPPSSVIIGAITVGGQEGDDRRDALFVAKDYITERLGLLPGTTLDIRVSQANSTLNVISNIQNACELIEQGAQLIIGPYASKAIKATEMISAALHIPHIAPTATLR